MKMNELLKEKNKHVNDERIRLHDKYEQNHIYLIDGYYHCDIGYKSVTELIKKYFPKFDANKVIDDNWDKWMETNDIRYIGMTKLEIIEMWKKRGEESRVKGNELHKVFEDFVNNKIDKSDISEFSNFKKWFDKEVGEPFRTEYIIFGEDEKVVGSIDFLYKNKDGKICIVDYKRTDVPNTYSFGKQCIGLDLPDTKVTLHQLQLNVYKYLLEKYYDIKVYKIYNLYIKEDTCVFLERDLLDMSMIFNRF